MASPKISVIVPVYNTEKYLSRCLDSILAQTLRNIEIIILNDGSTDQSADIINRYKNSDSRIKAFSHENRGLGPTRNRGIEIAKGEYLAFVDSDDYIMSDALENLYNCAISNQADVVVGEVELFYENSKDTRIRRILDDVKDIQLMKENKEFFYRNYYMTRNFSHNACDKLYRRKMVIDHKIVFGDNRRIFAEDNWFQLQVFQALPKICFINKKCYGYRQHSESIMHKPKKQLVQRHGNMIQDYCALIKKNGNQLADRKVCAIVAADVLVMEVLNQINIKGGLKEYKSALSGAKSNDALITNINCLTTLKAYDLEPKPQKRMYLKTIGKLYNLHLYSSAHTLVWFLYNFKGIVK